jgi:50S ribosomal protein L16 3-hydroxylase
VLLAWLSEPKSHVAFTPPRRLSRDEFQHVLNNGVVVPDLRTRLLYRGERVGINGEVWTPARPALSLLRRLADDRVLRGGAVTRGGAAAVELFHDAYQAGWLHIIRG